MPYKITGNCKECGKRTTHPKTILCRKCYLASNKSGELSPSFKGGKPNCKHCGKVLSTYTLKKNLCRSCHDKLKGSEHWNYKDGQRRSLNTLEYRTWRKSVFERDKYTCQKCNTVGTKLHAHHIVRWADSVELRYDINNGLTLCVKCHKLEHGWNIKENELLSVYPTAWGV